jgi:hypothetical protein
MDQAQVFYRFSKWGGIPRYVFEKTAKVDQRLLDQAIDAANLDSIFRYVGQSDIPDDASHKVVHMLVETNGTDAEIYTKFQIGLASKYVARKITSMSLSSSPSLPFLLSFSYFVYVRPPCTVPRGTNCFAVLYESRKRDELAVFLKTSSCDPKAASLRGV